MPGEMGADKRCSMCAQQGEPCTNIGEYIDRWKADPSLRAALKESNGALLRQQAGESQSQPTSPLETRVCSRMGCGAIISPSLPQSVILCDECLPIAQKVAEESLAKLKGKRRDSSSSTPPCRPSLISIPSVPDVPTVAISRRPVLAPPPAALPKVEPDAQADDEDVDMETLELRYPDEDVEMEAAPTPAKEAPTAPPPADPVKQDAEGPVALPAMLPPPPPMQVPPKTLPQIGFMPPPGFYPTQVYRACANTFNGCTGVVKPGSMARRCMNCVSADWKRMRAARPASTPRPAPASSGSEPRPADTSRTPSDVEPPSAKRKKVTWADLAKDGDQDAALSSNREKGEKDLDATVQSASASSSSSPQAGSSKSVTVDIAEERMCSASTATPSTAAPPPASESDSDTPLSTRSPRSPTRGRVLSWPPPGQHVSSDGEDSDTEVPLSSLARRRPGPLSKTETEPIKLSNTWLNMSKALQPTPSSNDRPATPQSAQLHDDSSPSSKPPPLLSKPTGLPKRPSPSPSAQQPTPRPSVPLPRRRVRAPKPTTATCPKQASLTAPVQATSPSDQPSAQATAIAAPSTTAASTGTAIASTSVEMSSSSSSAQAPITTSTVAPPSSSFAPLKLPSISHPIPVSEASSPRAAAAADSASGVDSDSDLTDLSELEAELVSDDSEDEEPIPQRPTGLKIRIPARPAVESTPAVTAAPAPALITGPTRPCRICKQPVPEEARWKCCEACRERTRLYQRARQNGEVEPQRRNLNAELAAVDRLLGDAARVVVGSRKCTMRFCMHVLPPAGEYKWKMCAACRSYVRATKKPAHGGKENGAEGEEGKGREATKRYRLDDNERTEPTPPGRCVSLDCGMVVSVGQTKCEQCTFRDEHPGQPRRMVTTPAAPEAPRKARRPMLPPRLPTPYPEFPTFMLLLVEFYTRLRDFLETQARYFLLATTAGRSRGGPSAPLLDAASTPAFAGASLFAFDGEYSVIAMDYDVLGRKEAVVQHARVLKDEIECAGRLKFGPTMWVSQADHGVVARFACEHDVLIRLPPVRGSATGDPADKNAPAPLHKVMRGELEIAIMADGSHRFFPGQRTVVRFRLVG
ncbi:hypothetical protein HDZ31DRAFT_30385 [Schizophyllum fasciatum]